ncbi:MAG: M48 family metalloprotease [Gammaproteobacteria bacterium]|nr:M48 family metalloprotease [Gammaproteobacteria bacterium]
MPISVHLLPLIFVIFFASLAHAQTEKILIPEMGNSADAIISPTEEKQTGEAVIRNIRRAGGIISDPILEAYINHLGYKLIAETQDGAQHFRFYMINDKQINAFALPGGFIGVNYGLIMAAESESELASVLAHEIAHVTQRHHARAYEVGDQQLPIVAALIAAMILGGGDSQLAEAAFATTAAGLAQSQINFTRGNEKEADRIGINMLANAGYSPSSMATFFDRMEKASRLYGPQAPEFLRTHPVNTSRISDAKSRAAQLPSPPLQIENDFHHTRARIRALANDNKNNAVTEFAKNLKNGNYQNKQAEQYGYALALIQAKKFNPAREIINSLLKKDPQRIAYLVTQAQLEAKSKNHQAANSIFTKALKVYPNNKVITYYYTKFLVEEEHFKKARQLLTEYMRDPVDNPELYRFLARSESAIGNKSAAHEAMGEYYFRSGQIHEAIQQIKLAIKTSNTDNFFRNSQLDAKIKLYQSQIIATP